MNHFLGYKAYSQLVVFLSLGLMAFAGVVLTLLSYLNVPGMQTFTPILMAGMLFSASFMAAGRFIKIEDRTPKLNDANTVALWTAAYLVGACFLIYSILTLLTWAMGGEASKMLSAESLGGVSSGVFGFVIISYIMIFLNFLLFSRFRKASTTG